MLALRTMRAVAAVDGSRGDRHDKGRQPPMIHVACDIEEARRLSVLLTATPYLGLVFERDSTMVRSVVSGGPAARAGLRRGDQLVKLGDAPTISPAEVRAALRQRKPGDWLAVEVRRSGDVINLPVEIGTLPADK